MVEVTELGYVGLGVGDLAAWRAFAGDILGLELVEGDAPGQVFLRSDYWHHRFFLHEDGSDDLLCLGLRVAGPEEFVAMQAQLDAAGIAFDVGSAELARARRVLEVLQLADPDGNPVEIFHGPLVEPQKPFHPARRMHGRFRTGRAGCGHCLVRQRDTDAGVRFYRALGMRGGIEYRVDLGAGPVDIHFMHCGTRDHAIAFGLGDPTRRLNHLMIEAEHFDDLGLTHDLVRAAGIPVTIQLGKHSNDQMYSFYFQSPSGFMIEYGWGGRDATHQSEYYAADVHGHAFEAGGF
ncbi:MAG: VOC family protein [Gammaproteobacteria bacterium]